MINGTKKITGNNRAYEIPRVEVAVLGEDILTVSVGGINIEYQENSERWNTPKINGSK